MNFLFWKKETTKNEAYAPYEEIDSKRTSKLGYFFLILMVIFGIWQGNQFLSSVQDYVESPQRNSYCASLLADYSDVKFNSYEYSYYGNDSRDSGFGSCNISNRESLAGLATAYKEAYKYHSKLLSLDTQINSLSNQRDRVQSSKKETLDEYQAALLEEMAQRNDAGLSPENIGAGYTSQKQNLSALDQQIARLQQERSIQEQNLKRIAITYTSQLTKIESDYWFETKKQQFIQFLISLLLVTPLFLFVWRRYNISKLNRSEFTIIWGGAVATFGFILAQILLVFVYEILPKEFLTALFSFLKAFEFVWTILYFLGFILVPLFFGFLIYIIQKKLYNKQAVLMRTLKSGHCPGCSLKITPDMNSCPICGYKIKNKCNHCGNMTLSGGHFCSICGSSQEESPTNN